MTAYYNASDTWMIFRAVLNNSILQLDWNALSKPMFILLFISNGCESDCFFLSVFRESLWKASLEIIIWCPSCQWMRKKGKELQLKNLPPSSVLYAASLIHAICHHHWSKCSQLQGSLHEPLVMVDCVMWKYFIKCVQPASVLIYVMVSFKTAIRLPFYCMLGSALYCGHM